MKPELIESVVIKPELIESVVIKPELVESVQQNALLPSP
jgi:hypothetical protein